MSRLLPLAVLLAGTSAMLSAAAQAPPAPASALARTPSPAGAKLYIASPANGAKVKSPVTVVFGLAGMGIAPAGMKFDNAGHHHLLIDSDVPKDLSLPLPATDKLVHFGKGQTEASVTLTPGTHTLQLLLGDHNHIPFDPVVASAKITITVE
jgi:hypothetical protein